MKILFLTDNFPPETNAPALRTHDHARRWVERGHEVVVITCAPNFPRGRVFDGYANRLFQRETLDGIRVIRVWTYISANEGFAKRIADYVSFMVAAVLASFVVRRPDIVVATSPQFFTAVAGWLVAGLKRRPWVFELRDLWPESIVAVGASSGGFLIDRLEAFSHFLYRRADLVVPVTRTFAERLRGWGVPDERIEVVTNGIDPDEIRSERDRASVRAALGLPADAFVAGFVGTIGMAHGIATIIDAATLTREDDSLHYVIMGEGADKATVRRLVDERSLENVTLLDGRPRKEALEMVAATDASLVVLKNTPVFETVIPSKIFEAMALRRPIVLGVKGEARRIVIDDADAGLAFPPEDHAALVACLRELQADRQRARDLGDHGHSHVEEHYRRTDLADRMANRLEQVVRARSRA